MLQQIICVLISFLCIAGLALYVKRYVKSKSVGTLQIIEADGEEPYIFLSLERNIETFMNDPIIKLNVSHKRVPHK